MVIEKQIVMINLFVGKVVLLSGQLLRLRQDLLRKLEA